MKSKLVFVPYFTLMILIFIFGYFTRGLTTKQEKNQITSSNFDIFKVNDDNTILKNKFEYYSLAESKTLEQDPSNLKNFLIEYYSSHSEYYYENLCLKDKDTCTLNNSEFKFTPVDLNDDGKKEYVIMPWKVCNCSMRGASGNGDILVVEKDKDNWEITGNLSGNGYNITKNKTNGFYDILVNSHGSAFSGVETVYKWTNKSKTGLKDQYEEVVSKWYRFTRSN